MKIKKMRKRNRKIANKLIFLRWLVMREWY